MSGSSACTTAISKHSASPSTQSANVVARKAVADRTPSEEKRDFARGGVRAPWRIPTGPPDDSGGARSSLGSGGKLSLQCKLTVGSTTDPLEAEADRMAEHVLAGQSASVSGAGVASAGIVRRCACGAGGQTCEACADEKKKKTIRRRATGEVAPVEAPPIVHDVIRSSGRPLDDGLRRDMESGFGGDFSRVRVHTGSTADASARAIGAHAYTTGQNIVFANGQYAPAQTSGRRLIAHELAHVMQQGGSPETAAPIRRKAKVAQCGLLDVAGTITDIGRISHVQIQDFLAAKGVQREFKISRGTKFSPGWGCRKLGTPYGSVDLARPSPAGWDIAEIKPISIPAVAKLEVGHYRRRATQSMQRLFKQPGTCAKRPPGPDDAWFASTYGLSALSTFSRLSGVLSGDVEIGPYRGDPSLTLKAKEVGAGAVCYWCVKDKSKKEEKETKPPGPNVGFGISIGGSAGGAYNAGVGISIQSDSTAYGTAGAGVSYKSDTKAAGVAGAGASMDSDSMAAGSVGAGASKDTQSIGAGTAGAGTSSGSMSAGAGVAGAGSSKDSALAAAGAAGKGSVKDSAVAVAGSHGSGHIEGVAGAGTGSPGKPVDAKDTEVGGGKAGTPSQSEAGGAEGGTHADSNAAAQPGQVAGGKDGQAGSASGAGTGAHAGAGTTAAGEKHGDQTGGANAGAGSGSAAAQGSGSGPSPGGPESAAEKGAQAARQAGTDPGSGTGPAADGTAAGSAGGTGTGTGASKVPGGLAVGPIAGPAASDADREKANVEAGKVAALVANATPAQLALFRYLAQASPDKQYVVPASEWVDKMMKATAGMSEDDIKYLQSLNWTPANISAEELRKRLEAALKTKKPPADNVAKAGTGGTDKKDATGDKDGGKTAKGEGSGPGSGPGSGNSQGSKAGAGKKGGPDGPTLSGFSTPHKYEGKIAHVDDTGFQIQPNNQITTSTTKGTKLLMEVRWQEGREMKRAKVEYEIVSDPVPTTDSTGTQKRLSFSLKSTNTDPLELSTPGTVPPTVVPANAPGIYFINIGGKK